jgi:hypothetical protein
MIKHIPSVLGTAVLFGICYILAYVPLTGAQMFIAIVVLFLVYSATVVWYLKKTL